MKLRFTRFAIHPRIPFTIARGSTTSYDRVHVRLTDDEGLEGWGEAAPNTYYRETAETVEAALPRLASVLERARTIGHLDEVALLERDMRAVVAGDASARAAVSAAAHDLLGKKRNAPVFELFGLDPNLAPPSSFTIVISDEPGMLHQVNEARAYPILKVKLGTDRDEWIVRTVRRAAPRKLLRADANAAWDVQRAIEMSKLLAENGFELLEQPLAPDDIEGFRKLHAQSPMPIIADESCRTSADIPRLDGSVHGINIKLSKCGGLAEARLMAGDARRRRMKVMLGCMVESSLGISAAAQLAALAGYADLDGAALLKDDPFVGARIDDGVIRLRAEPGLGVKLKASS